MFSQAGSVKLIGVVIAASMFAIVGCSSPESDLLGAYSGTLTRNDHSVQRVSTVAPSVVDVTRTSGGATIKEAHVSIESAGGTSGTAAFRMKFGEGCEVLFSARSGGLVSETDAHNLCSCPVGEQAVEGSVVLSGSLDEANRQLSVVATVHLGGPTYGGGCTYVFSGRRS